MNKRHFVEEYLQGRKPLHAERPSLPDEAQLDAAEREFDRLAAQHEASPFAPARRRRLRRAAFAAAAAVLIAVGVGLWAFRVQHPPKPQERVPTTVPLVAEKLDTTGHDVAQRITETIEPQPATIKIAARHDDLSGTPSRPSRLAATAGMPSNPSLPPGEDGGKPQLLTTADSLNYCLEKIEKMMQEIDDSLYMASIEQLMQVDVRLQRMVEQATGRLVESTMQEHEESDSAQIIIL